MLLMVRFRQGCGSGSGPNPPWNSESRVRVHGQENKKLFFTTERYKIVLKVSLTFSFVLKFLRKKLSSKVLFWLGSVSVTESGSGLS
jgi:hypothetical protein